MVSSSDFPAIDETGPGLDWEALGWIRQRVVGGCLWLGLGIELGVSDSSGEVATNGGVCGSLGALALYTGTGLASRRMGVVAPIAAMVKAILPV